MRFDRTRWYAIAFWAVSFGLGCQAAKPGASAGNPDAISLATFRFLFKLDPRLAGGTYGGERWVSPPTYSIATQRGPESTVEIKVEGVDSKGKPVRIHPKWSASDPQMVTVSPVSANRQDHIRIAIKRPGESKLEVTAEDLLKELVVRAKPVGTTSLQIEVVQPP